MRRPLGRTNPSGRSPTEATPGTERGRYFLLAELAPAFNWKSRARLQTAVRSATLPPTIGVNRRAHATRQPSILFAVTAATSGVLLIRLLQDSRAQHTDAAYSTTVNAQNASRPIPLILQENDGEHRIRRPGGPAHSGSVPEFIIKIDKENGGAEDFYVGAEILKPGAVIPFHKHHNSEEVVIMEEGGATVAVGDKRAVA